MNLYVFSQVGRNDGKNSSRGTLQFGVCVYRGNDLLFNYLCNDDDNDPIINTCPFVDEPFSCLSLCDSFAIFNY